MYRDIANQIKNIVVNFVPKCYIYKPIPKDANELNQLGKVGNDFEVAFINRTIISAVFKELGVKDGALRPLLSQIGEVYNITIFSAVKDEDKYNDFQNKVEQIVVALALSEWEGVWELEDVTANHIEFYLLGEIVCHRFDIKVSFRKQI
jgi:hypothetical protein